jgi:DNA replication and repair protein RecF
LRCLAEVELKLQPARNVIYGPNGAGKTSLLEAVHVLGRGRSFRSRDTRLLIQRGATGFSVFGEVVDQAGRHRLGIGLGSAGLTRRLNGRACEGMAEMAGLMPVFVIEPGIHQLIEGGPRLRRQFLDWAVFHVEPSYIEWWKQYRRALAQRNAGLKAGWQASGLAPWTSALAEAGERIDAARAAHTETLSGPLADLGKRLLGADLGLRYQRGWRKGVPLLAALEEALARDRLAGVSQVGPHRADWRVELQGFAVREGASRGQQKLVAIALVVAQVLAAAREAGGARSVLLVDDPAAELDRGRLDVLLEVLDELPGQQIVTGLSPEHLPARAADWVFHVERGKVDRVL